MEKIEDLKKKIQFVDKRLAQLSDSLLLFIAMKRLEKKIQEVIEK